MMFRMRVHLAEAVGTCVWSTSVTDDVWELSALEEAGD